MHLSNNKEAGGGEFHLPQMRLHGLDIHRVRSHPSKDIFLDPDLIERRIDLKLSILHGRRDARLGQVYFSERPPYFVVAANPDTNRRRIALFDPKHRERQTSTGDIPIHLSEGLILIEGGLNLWVCKKPEALPDLVALRNGRIVTADAPDRARVIANWIHKFLNLEHP